MLTLQKMFDFCPNYDKIVSYHYLSDDGISKRLIDFYEESVLNRREEENLDQMIELDTIMNLYVQDSRFSDYVKQAINDISISNMEIYTDLIYYLIDIYNQYKKDHPGKTSRWL